VRRIAILSVIDEEYDDKAYAGIAAISNDNKSRYAARYGYALVVCGNLAPERNIAWSKIRGVQALLGQGFDWVFVMDADVIITNPAIRLEALIDDVFDLIITRDENGFNAGNFFVRNGPETREFFGRVWETREFEADCPAILESQEAIARALQYRPPSFVKIAAQRQFNAYWAAREGNWEPGDFLIHFAGMGGERADLRLKLMHEYAERVDWAE
jgi:glycosyltransferase involved in cell wall biosynthesis